MQPDETTFGWRLQNNCDQDSTPYPAITFTDLPSTTAAAGKKKRAAGFDDNNEDTTDTFDSSNVDSVSEGTDSVAYGIKYNWCVPRIYAWWWRKHGGKLPGRSSENDDSSSDWSNDWSNDDSNDDR